MAPRAKKRRVAIVGVGRVGTALALALDRAGWPIVALWNRSPGAARALRKGLGDSGASVRQSAARAAAAAELVFLTVSDDALEDVAGEIAPAVSADHVVIHTSGVKDAAALNAIAAQGAGVGALHPLMTFARPPATGKEARAWFRDVRWVLDGPDLVQDIAQRIVGALGGQLLDVPAAGRAHYHAAAVVASNYVVALAAEACAMLDACGLDEDEALAALIPLLRGTVENLATQAADGGTAAGALSGPVARGDASSVRRHLDALAGDDARARLYRSLGRRCLDLARARGLDPALARAMARALAEPRD